MFYAIVTWAVRKPRAIRAVVANQSPEEVVVKELGHSREEKHKTFEMYRLYNNEIFYYD